MRKISILPPGWKKQIEARIPSLPQPYDRDVLIGLLEKQETEDAAGALWQGAVDVSKNNADSFLAIMLELLYCLASRPSDSESMSTRTRSGWLALVRAMEVIQKDGVFFQPESLDDTEIDGELPFADGSAPLLVRYTGSVPLPDPNPRQSHPLVPEGYDLNSLSAAIRWYRKRAELATNTRKRSYPEKLSLMNLRLKCALFQIRPWIKVVSPLMRAAFGPTWTEGYTKRRDSDWRIRLTLAETMEWIRNEQNEVPFSE